MTSTYVHHTPGRLRIKHPQLKASAAYSDRCQAYARSIHGVRSAQVTAATGSLLIEYDPAVLNADALVALLNMPRSLGCLPAAAAGTSASGPGDSSAVSRCSARLSSTIADALIAKGVEAAVAALVAACF